MKALFALAFALLAGPASASENLVFLDQHKDVKITSSFHGRLHHPYALSYEGPKGHYVITFDDLHGLGYDDTDTQTRYNIYRFDGHSLVHAADNRAGEGKVAFDDPAIVPMVEDVIGQLVKKGKKQAPEELKASIAALEDRARRLDTRRKALSLAESIAPGTVKDAASLAGLEADIAASRAAAKRVEAVRAEVEPKLGTLIDPNNPNPKASFYAGMGSLLADEQRGLDRVASNLDWQLK